MWRVGEYSVKESEGRFFIYHAGSYVIHFEDFDSAMGVTKLLNEAYQAGYTRGSYNAKRSYYE